MSFDRSQGRCSFCGRRASEVRRMIAGPGAAYICDECLAICNDILHEDTPFSMKALELASRPPVVTAISFPVEGGLTPPARESLRTVTVELEQKQHGMILMLRELQLFPEHFELHYLWIRPPLPAGFLFIPRLIFLVRDSSGMQWSGDRGGILLARPELASDPARAVYEGNARFRPTISNEAHTLHVRAADPLGQFEDPPLKSWEFEITLAPF